MDMQLRKVLEHTRQLLEKGWCQESYARDAQGAECRKFSDDAVSFCLLGAFKRAQDDLNQGFFLDEELEDALGVFKECGGVVEWNDDPNRTKEEVLARIDKALA